MAAKKSENRFHNFTPEEERAARSERVKVRDAEPYGWVAYSDSEGGKKYHLICSVKTKALTCTCADFVYRGKREPGYECMHISAVLKFVGRNYLAKEYNPLHQRTSAA
jgi:hypothetical protein